MARVIEGNVAPELSRYVIEDSPDSILGVGGMGAVFRAHDLLLDRAVAIKTISSKFVHKDGKTLFFREAVNQARLGISHPNHVVPVRNYGIEDSMPFMELELLEGGSLRDRIERAIASGAKPPLFKKQRIKSLCKKIAKGLSILHRERAYHMDLKPENILFASSKAWAPRIADLGLAQIAESGLLTRAGVRTFFGGTRDYTPRDVHSGRAKASPRTDLYSLGVILFELLTGSPLRWEDASLDYVRKRPNLSGDAKDLIIRTCRLLGRNNFNEAEVFLEAIESSQL